MCVAPSLARLLAGSLARSLAQPLNGFALTRIRSLVVSGCKLAKSYSASKTSRAARLASAQSPSLPCQRFHALFLFTSLFLYFPVHFTSIMELPYMHASCTAGGATKWPTAKRHALVGAETSAICTRAQTLLVRPARLGPFALSTRRHIVDLLSLPAWTILFHIQLLCPFVVLGPSSAHTHKHWLTVSPRHTDQPSGTLDGRLCAFASISLKY